MDKIPGWRWEARSNSQVSAGFITGRRKWSEVTLAFASNSIITRRLYGAVLLCTCAEITNNKGNGSWQILEMKHFILSRWWIPNFTLVNLNKIKIIGRTAEIMKSWRGDKKQQYSQALEMRNYRTLPSRCYSHGGLTPMCFPFLYQHSVSQKRESHS